jgi:hypothetical protein
MTATRILCPACGVNTEWVHPLEEHPPTTDTGQFPIVVQVAQQWKCSRGHAWRADPASQPAPPVPTTAAEIIARYDALTAQIEALVVERAALPVLAVAWRNVGGSQPFFVRTHLTMHDNLATVQQFGRKQWEWATRSGGYKWHDATPNTEAGAKACADAALLADGVVLA